MHSLRRGFERISSLGIRPDLPRALVKRVRLTNQVNGVLLLCAMAGIPRSLLEEKSAGGLVGILAIAVLAHASALLLNACRLPLLSRLLTLLMPTAFALWFSLQFGFSIGIGMLLLSLVGAPFVLFDPKERAPLLVGVALPSLLCLALSVWMPQGQAEQSRFFSADLLRIQQVVATLGLQIALFLRLNRENARSEGRLEELLSQVVKQQEALIQSNRMSALGEMAGGVAHEINNPMAIVHLQADRLRRLGAKEPNPAAAEFAKACDVIDSATARVSRIVQGLLAFSHDASRDPFARTGLREILDATLDLCRARLENDGVSLKLAGSLRDVKVDCRATEISQALLNLLSNSHNAVRGASEKWIALEVLDRGTDAEITVTDSGPGIPAAMRDKIFQPFFTTQEVGRGTGLGLSVAQGIIENHGGTLAFDPSAAHTRMVVRLPKAPPQPG